MWYGIFQWVFMGLGFILGIVALLRIEVFSSHSTQRTGGHPAQQVALFFFSGVFILAGFIAAILAVNNGT